MGKGKSTTAKTSRTGAKAKKKPVTKQSASKKKKLTDAETGNVPTIPADNSYKDENRVTASQDNPILQLGPGGLAGAMREIIRRDQEQADETRQILEDFFFGDDEDEEWDDENDFEEEE